MPSCTGTNQALLEELNRVGRRLVQQRCHHLLCCHSSRLASGSGRSARTGVAETCGQRHARVGCQLKRSAAIFKVLLPLHVMHMWTYFLVHTCTCTHRERAREREKRERERERERDAGIGGACKRTSVPANLEQRPDAV